MIRHIWHSGVSVCLSVCASATKRQFTLNEAMNFQVSVFDTRQYSWRMEKVQLTQHQQDLPNGHTQTQSLSVCVFVSIRFIPFACVCVANVQKSTFQPNRKWCALNIVLCTQCASMCVIVCSLSVEKIVFEISIFGKSHKIHEDIIYVYSRFNVEIAGDRVNGCERRVNAIEFVDLDTVAILATTSATMATTKHDQISTYSGI